MLCKDIEQKLPAYLEDDLSPQEKVLVEEHLTSCPQCVKAVENLKKTGKLVREIEGVEPPPWFTQKIMTRVREEAKQKKSIFLKLFYPLHIKIPIQALATILIAVIAFQIYRVGDPEMKGVVAPPAAVFEAEKEHAPAAPQKTPEFAPAPSAKRKAVPMKEEKKDKGIPFAPPDKPTEAMKKAISVRQQEPSKSTPAPALEYKRDESGYFADPAREKREYEAAPAAPRVMGMITSEPARIGVVVHVKDESAAAGEVEALLGKSGARKIQRQSLDDKEVLTAVIKAQNLRELIEKLKAFGETEEEGIPVDIREQDISIKIEILRDH